MTTATTTAAAPASEAAERIARAQADAAEAAKRLAEAKKTAADNAAAVKAETNAARQQARALRAEAKAANAGVKQTPIKDAGAFIGRQASRGWDAVKPARDWGKKLVTRDLNPFSFKLFGKGGFIARRPILVGGAAALAAVGIVSNMGRNRQAEEVQQGLMMAQQQLQAGQIQAAMAMHQAQAGGMMPNHAAPQIMAGSAQHMGMMDAAPELARG